ncbi:PREDICTED: uncharacterized protein LOC106814088 [Priapulus caudatus]|uniref:Uncharacterized protein LOC106814088 n=1 Tax=Priapulus caudatus TaxID=37621 RepID=A0ABM1ENS9_PRICU|nr:PREDICTED: uncharacterized protein LOC106814088 [Priapulus caudatus]
MSASGLDTEINSGFDKSLSMYLHSLDISNIDVDMVTISDYRHDFEKAMKRKLTKNERKVFRLRIDDWYYEKITAGTLGRSAEMAIPLSPGKLDYSFGDDEESVIKMWTTAPCSSSASADALSAGMSNNQDSQHTASENDVQSVSTSCNHTVTSQENTTQFMPPADNQACASQATQGVSNSHLPDPCVAMRASCERFFNPLSSLSVAAPVAPSSRQDDKQSRSAAVSTQETALSSNLHSVHHEMLLDSGAHEVTQQSRVHEVVSLDDRQPGIEQSNDGHHAKLARVDCASLRETATGDHGAALINSTKTPACLENGTIRKQTEPSEFVKRRRMATKTEKDSVLMKCKGWSIMDEPSGGSVLLECNSCGDFIQARLFEKHIAECVVDITSIVNHSSREISANQQVAKMSEISGWGARSGGDAVRCEGQQVVTIDETVPPPTALLSPSSQSVCVERQGVGGAKSQLGHEPEQGSVVRASLVCPLCGGFVESLDCLDKHAGQCTNRPAQHMWEAATKLLDQSD